MVKVVGQHLFAVFENGCYTLLTHLASCHVYVSVNWVSIDSGKVCRLLDAKPLPEAMLTYCQLDSWNQISAKIE